jgi:hypothetical protein
MTYLSALQVKNLLAKKGIKRGTKTSYAKNPRNGLTTTQLGDGWVMVEFFDSAEAMKEKVDPRSYNHDMREIIHFVLKDMHEFEYRHEARPNPFGTAYDHFYRKAI